MAGESAVIVGGGPAGLTAAYELLARTDVKPLVFEMTGELGGLARTKEYRGNRIDIGGHRFFSKSDRIMNWWLKILPLQGAPARDDLALGRFLPLSLSPDAPDPERIDRVMLVRSRLSRIFFLRKFFDYPLSLDLATFRSMGFGRLSRIALSYARGHLFPRPAVRNLEDFFIDRFGRELYRTFFKSYTEKVWGVPCNRIDPAWGAQRVKGLSISRALLHALRKGLASDSSLAQRDTETSLIDKFMYPKLGPGQMWEEVARLIRERGGEIHLRHRLVSCEMGRAGVTAATFEQEDSRQLIRVAGNYFFSTVPVKDLVATLGPDVPSNVREVAEGLVYRDFMTVGLLLKKLKIVAENGARGRNGLIPDNWIYIQEEAVKLGRLQIFNNWSPYLVRDENTVWLGLEYFCNQGDELWRKPDDDLIRFATGELAKIGIIGGGDVLDATVVRAPKAYPAYLGSYGRFHEIRRFTDSLDNLFLIGRNGMHRYNNQDHSMLAAMVAVENIVQGKTSKENIWAVNAEQDYHEGGMPDRGPRSARLGEVRRSRGLA